MRVCEGVFVWLNFKKFGRGLLAFCEHMLDGLPPWLPFWRSCAAPIRIQFQSNAIFATRKPLQIGREITVFWFVRVWHQRLQAQCG